MRFLAATAVVALTLTACAPASDVVGPDTDTDGAGPDITGNYLVTVDAGTGCDDQTALSGWSAGALAVSGPSDALVLDFGEGAILSGTLDSAFALDFTGQIARTGDTLDIVGSGVAYMQDAVWGLDGDLAVSVTGVDSPCTIEGPFRATQVVE